MFIFGYIDLVFLAWHMTSFSKTHMAHNLKFADPFNSLSTDIDYLI